MQRYTNNQEEIEKAIADGKADTRDLSTIIEQVIIDILPVDLRERMNLESSVDLLDAYKLVEKTFDPIPWVDPNCIVIAEIPSRIIFDKKVQKHEIALLEEKGFPRGEAHNVIESFIVADKKKREEVESVSGQQYTRQEQFIFTWLRPEGKKGVLLTEMDRTKESIYSVATSINVGLNLRKQYNHFKTVLMYLMSEMPFTEKITSLQYAFETTHGNRLHFFISIK